MKAHGLNPRIRKSPFFESCIKYGATEFHPYNGMWMPVGYDTPLNEYWDIVERASIWDVSIQRMVEISGPDAEAFTNLLTTRDISKVPVGQCRYIVLTNQDGGIINDPVMLRIAKDKFWLSTADSDMYLWASGVATFSGHNVNVKMPKVYSMGVQGPVSPKIVASVFGDHVLDLKYYHWMDANVDGIDVVISRTGYSFELGFEIHLIGQERGNDLWEKIMAVGKPMGLAAGAPNRIRRIEAGALDYGSDMTPAENPLEMGMERLVDFDKPDFIGKAALQKVQAEGVTRKMVGVYISGEAFEKNNEQRWTALRNNKPVGQVTQGAYSPRLKRNIGLALLDITECNSNTGLTVDTPEGERQLSITPLPFYDPNKKIPRASLRDSLSKSGPADWSKL